MYDLSGGAVGVNQKAKKKRLAGALWFSFGFVLCKDVFVCPAAVCFPNDPVLVQQ